MTAGRVLGPKEMGRIGHNVAASDHDADLHAESVDLLDLASDLREHRRVDARTLVPGEHLAR